MASVNLHNPEGGVVGTVELPQSAFGVDASEGAIYYALKAIHTNQRQGTVDTLTRAEVDLTKKKIYRQKGTGRARVGTAGSPIRVGGGVAHGPHQRTIREHVPKKVKRLAFRSALSQKAAGDAVRVVEDFSLEAPKTKRMAGLLRGLKAQGKVLLVTASVEPNVFLSCRNLPHVQVTPAAQVSTYDVVWADVLVIAQGALSGLQSRAEAS